MLEGTKIRFMISVRARSVQIKYIELQKLDNSLIHSKTYFCCCFPLRGATHDSDDGPQ